ncbi:zinc-finger domain-containing protein [Ectothiorhodospiraceae bacterium BW-2]|nr:zinc-finger domain-containing protein [Ectothiorhodospiraceae bacterium BW-2]
MIPATSPITIERSELPLHCPRPAETLWNSHPRVFLDIEASGRAKCPYCGAEYHLPESD